MFRVPQRHSKSYESSKKNVPTEIEFIQLPKRDGFAIILENGIGENNTETVVFRRDPFKYIFFTDIPVRGNPMEVN